MAEEARIARAEYMRQYRKDNKERINKYRRKWAKENPEKIKAYADAHWERKAMDNNS